MHAILSEFCKTAVENGMHARWALRIAAKANAMVSDESGAARALSWAWAQVSATECGDIPQDATDSELRDLAQYGAEKYQSERKEIGGASAQRRAQARLRGCKVAAELVNEAGAWRDEQSARAACPIWWLRQLRRALGRNAETGAIRLGFVHKGEDCYASNEAVKRRREQVKRNQAAIESVDLVAEETGETVNLAEIVKRSTANKAIRRGELMTRMRGFEEFGKLHNHQAYFITLTAPSRFHPISSKTGAKNPNWRGETPRDANAWLQKIWARIRAEFHRRNVRVYGFRIAEPHHDSCPHFHFLLWECVGVDSAGKSARDIPNITDTTVVCDIPAAQYSAGVGNKYTLKEIFERKALSVDGQEVGASKYRVKTEVIDPTKGGATAYVAKYVAKNIDGYSLEKDLYGNDAIVASERIETWATTWGIRQFQQIGGAPVGIWRECRRVPLEAAARAGDEIHGAVIAANRDAQNLASWAQFLKVMGGATLRRDEWRVQLHKRAVSYQGRYETVEKNAPKGVSDLSGLVVLSSRKTWTVRTRAKRGLGHVSITVRPKRAINRFMRGVAHLNKLKDASQWVKPQANFQRYAPQGG